MEDLLIYGDIILMDDDLPDGINTWRVSSHYVIGPDATPCIYVDFPIRDPNYTLKFKITDRHNIVVRLSLLLKNSPELFILAQSAYISKQEIIENIVDLTSHGGKFQISQHVFL